MDEAFEWSLENEKDEEDGEEHHEDQEEDVEGEEDGGGGFVTIEYDAEVLSPKNAFIVVDKARRGG